MTAAIASYFMGKRKTPLYCSFCRKSDADVSKLIGGPGVYICDACVELCNRILAGKPTPSFAGFESLDDDAVLRTLQPSLAALETTRAVLQEHVELLRKRGVSWQKIGDALGMTRQAAWERFG